MNIKQVKVYAKVCNYSWQGLICPEEEGMGSICVDAQGSNVM